MQAAVELTEKGLFEKHISYKFGINENKEAKPLQAVIPSNVAFTIGEALPLLEILYSPIKKWNMGDMAQICFYLLF